MAAASLLLLLSSVVPIGIAAAPAGALGDAPPTVFDPQATNRWGVGGLDRGSGNFRFYSPVIAMAQIGDTFYAGGKFTNANNGTNTVEQPYLAAFSASGDELRSAFRPGIDWSVFALETAADGSRLFVGGEFTGVAGAPDSAAFAALDPDTGALDTSFGVSVGRAAQPPRVHALERNGRWLYIGGAFSRITGADGRSFAVSNVARVDAATGVVDGAWRPRVTSGSVWDLAIDPDRGRVLLGGRFLQVNGVDTRAFAIVDDGTGQIQAYDRSIGVTHFNHRNGNIFLSTVEVAGDRVILGGQDHRVMITTLDLSTIASYKTNRWEAVTIGKGGDTQALAVRDGVVYVACHCWGQARNETTGELYDVRSLYALDLATGAWVDGFAPDMSGQSGPWALHFDGDGCLWVGSDATQVGQRRGNGLARLCERDNLATGITAVSSEAGPLPSGDRLVDGDLVTNWFGDHQGAVTETANRPYIEVELAESVHIDRLVLWNRTDEHRTRLHDLHVWVSDQPMDRSWGALRDDRNVTEIVRAGSHHDKRTMSVTVGRTARYVRIQVDARAEGGGQVNLTELAIFGREAVQPPTGPGGCQVAVDGATVTVTWTDTAADHVIFRSVDGSRLHWRGRVGGGSFSDELRAGMAHTYSVAAVSGARIGQTVTCTPGEVRTGAPSTISLTSPLQTRDRIVLRWNPVTSVTILRDGVEIGADDDGWFTDRTVAPGTSYTYTVRSGGAEGTLTIASAS